MTTKAAPFTDKFLKQITELLEKEKITVEKDLAKFTKRNKLSKDNDFDTNYPEYGDEEDDNAREIADYTANKPLELTLEKTYRDIIKSLERIKKGGYGICKYCHKPIAENRLMARPTSSACVSCKKTITDEI